jgi:fatty-acyl-CoA synthase
MEVANTQTGSARERFSGFALLLSIFSVVWFVIAAFGTKFGLWSWQFGLGKMTMAWGPPLVMLAVGLSVAALIVALLKAPRKRAVMLALGALLVSGLVFGRLAGAGAQAAALPPLHDIQTNWADPVKPTAALLEARAKGGALNGIEDAPKIESAADGRWPGLGGRLVSEVQEDAEFDTATHKDPDEKPYPTLETQVSPVPFDVTFKTVEGIVRARGWDVVTVDSKAGIIEATETSFAFGFKDDVMIRFRPVDGVAAIDIRSTSRVGLSDLGANAKRISNLQEDIRRSLSAAASPPPG